LPLLIAGYAMVAWYVDRYLLGIDWRAYWSLPRLAMNGLPGALCILLLAVLTRRVLVPVAVVTVLHVALLVVSRLKLAILHEPLAFHDAYFLTNFDRSSLVLFSSYVNHWGRDLAILAVMVSLLGAVWWVERPRSKTVAGPALAVRVLVGLAGLWLLLGLHAGSAPWSKIYSKQNVRPVAWDAKMALLRSGLVSSLVQQVVADRAFTLNVDADALEYVERATGWHHGSGEGGAAAASGNDLPNIVVVLSESFMDPRVMKGMAGLEEKIPTVRRLQDAGSGGLMRVPTYGGGTVKTEFEVLTGMPLAAFPGINFPYFTLAARDRIPALPSILKADGYRSVAIHGNSPAFWSRNVIFRSMGFQDFQAEAAFEKQGVKDGRWYSDASMTDLVLDELRRSKTPTFVLAISMENHGPYSGKSAVNDPGRRDSITLPEGVVSQGAQLELRNYLYHLGNADSQLARLVSELGKEPRPYVVLFFGDHLPALGAAYDEAGFVDGRPAGQQLVPWVIARDPRLPEHDLSKVTESWQLPVALFDAAGLDGGDYLRLSREAMRLYRGEGDRQAAKKLLDGLNAAANQHLERGLQHDAR
jgi:phosphoglycerol transferase MdoB-like AlkP superfamily enzyme